MNKLDLIKLARQNLWRRKLRTILTVLGVLIGTTSIVVMLSLGIGLDESQRKSMERWGSLTMIQIHQGIVFDDEGNPVGEAKRLNDDAVAELKGLEGVIAVSPAFEVGGEARLGQKSGWAQLIGIDAAVMNQLEYTPLYGRLLEAGDSNVVVAGSQVINQFFSESDRRMMERGKYDYRRNEQGDPSEMMDKRLTLMIQNRAGKKRNFNYTVVGVLDGNEKEYAYQMFGSIEDIKRIRQYMLSGAQGNNGNMSPMQEKMIISAGTRIGRVTSTRRDDEDRENDYSYIMVRTAGVEVTGQVSQAIKDLGYSCWSIADSLEGIEKTSRTVQAILGGIGAITLLVAALGITNTMIMSIYERTKEIGIMKVIGATFSDIHSLFMVEAGMIGFIGGTLGLGLSYGVSKIINHIAGQYLNNGMAMEEVTNISLIPPYLALFAVGFAIIIGLVAGLYPAYRAVRLSPISAIRNE